MPRSCDRALTLYHEAVMIDLILAEHTALAQLLRQNDVQIAGVHRDLPRVHAHVEVDYQVLFRVAVERSRGHLSQLWRGQWVTDEGCIEVTGIGRSISGY